MPTSLMLINDCRIPTTTVVPQHLSVIAYIPLERAKIKIQLFTLNVTAVGGSKPHVFVPGLFSRRKAAAEEERFDFLRPLLAPPDKQKHPASAPDRGKRKGGTTSGRRAGQARKKENPTGLGMSSTMGGMAAVSDLGAGAKVSGAGKGGDLLEFAGLDEAARMALLLGGPSTTHGVASGTGDEDEDEDYD